MPKKVVVLLSGGLDSVLSLAELVAKPVSEIERVHALIFDYGQSSSAEIECAKTICTNWRVPYEIRKIQLMTGSDTHSEIPARNFIFVSYAASVAMSMHYNCIAIGAEPDSTYTDSSIEFLDQTNSLLKLFDLGLVAPVKHYRNKYELVTIALDLGVPLHLCHSSRTNAVDGNCKTSALLFSALKRLFPAIEPISLLQELGKLQSSYDNRLDTYQVSYSGNHSFKYPAAMFALSEKLDWESTKVYSTGSWMREISSVSTMLGIQDKFSFEKTDTTQDLISQPLNCNSKYAQWGIKQAMSFLPRPRYVKSVSCRIIQGHLAAALADLGYQLELPAYRCGPYIETTLQNAQN